jgi:hypothetical protein
VTILDKVLFKMPTDRELLFPAMAVLQHFVNGFDNKMKANDVSHDKETEYRLRYDVEIAGPDWGLFERLGLKLNQGPVPIGLPDMIVDLREEKTLQFRESGKHVCQVYGVLSGVGCPPIPTTRKVAPDFSGGSWVSVGQIPGMKEITGEQLLDTVSGQYSGIVGRAGWETYVTCCLGLPVVEIIPADRPRQWLSKWTHQHYRMVVESDHVARDVRSAIVSLNAWLKGVLERKEAMIGSVQRVQQTAESA